MGNVLCGNRNIRAGRAHGHFAAILIQYGPRRRSAASQEKDLVTEMFSFDETMSPSCVQVKITHI